MDFLSEEFKLKLKLKLNFSITGKSTIQQLAHACLAELILENIFMELRYLLSLEINLCFLPASEDTLRPFLSHFLVSEILYRLLYVISKRYLSLRATLWTSL